jgi:hypothetical protein
MCGQNLWKEKSKESKYKIHAPQLERKRKTRLARTLSLHEKS